MGAIERCSKLLQVQGNHRLHCSTTDARAALVQRIRAALSSVLNANRDLDQVLHKLRFNRNRSLLTPRLQVSEATDRCEQLREALAKCETRLGAALEQVAAECSPAYLLCSHSNACFR